MDDRFIWHGRRYWTSEPKANEIPGWNTRFEACSVLRKTAKRIYILSPTFGPMQLNREAFERAGKVYHSKVHEWFYKYPFTEKFVNEKLSGRNPNLEASLSALGLSHPTTQAAIKRAYKERAKSCHPDTGGSHDAFLRLKAAYETAMKGLDKCQ